jgi:O-antigen/teichoic acid export membrane protein
MQPLTIHSLRLNFVLNNTRLVLNLLVPLIIFLHVSRVLGPSGLGKVEFANSIVSYFVLFTALGVPTYGIREIARRRDDPIERSKVVWELTLILAGTIGAGYIAYFLLTRFIPSLYESRHLFLVIAPVIFLSDFSYEWFYIGIEDQLYITIRFIIIKILQVALIFLWVMRASDFVIYAAISVGLNGFATVFNISRLRKYICRIPFSQLNVRRHIKSVLLIFASLVAVNVYMHLDVTMVGALVGAAAVGLYTAANRIVRIIITLVTSISAVIIPRIENALRSGDREAYKNYLDASLHFILIFSVPCCFGLLILAPDIIRLFAGEQYLESIMSVRLLCPIVIIVGLANFVGLQVLYANRRESCYTIAVSVAAVVNAVFNFVMIPVYKQNGAIVGTVLAEMVGLIIQIWFARDLLKDTELFSWNTAKYFVAGSVMAVAVMFLRIYIGPAVIISIISGSIVYTAMLVVLRERMVINIAMRLVKR